MFTIKQVSYREITITAVDWLEQTANVITGLTAEVSSENAVRLDWTTDGVGFDGVKIERSEDGVTYTEIATVNFSTNYYEDVDLIKFDYFYRVRLYKGDRNFAYIYCVVIPEYLVDESGNVIYDDSSNQIIVI